MASNDNKKRKGGDKTFWDIIADYALIWWAVIMLTIVTAFIMDWMRY